jgi:hypothetical protein
MANWWRLNQKQRATYDIEWDSVHGVVRARLNDGKVKTEWVYEKVYDCYSAEWIGNLIVDRLRKKI